MVFMRSTAAQLQRPAIPGSRSISQLRGIRRWAGVGESVTEQSPGKKNLRARNGTPTFTVLLKLIPGGDSWTRKSFGT